MIPKYHPERSEAMPAGRDLMSAETRYRQTTLVRFFVTHFGIKVLNAVTKLYMILSGVRAPHYALPMSFGQIASTIE